MTFILEDDPVRQQEYLRAAYDNVMKRGGGVVVSDDVLARYRNIRHASSMSLVAAVKKYYSDTLAGKRVNACSPNGSMNILFGDDGKRKSVGWRMKPEKAAVFERLAQLLENSIYAYSQENRNEDERVFVPRFHYFVNNAKFPNLNIPVKVHVRELNFAGGTEYRYYTHSFIKK